MRMNGTKYEDINSLPPNAIVVSRYAQQTGYAVGYIYIKYERYLKGEGTKPPYTIKCFQGSNFIIPE